MRVLPAWWCVCCSHPLRAHVLNCRSGTSRGQSNFPNMQSHVLSPFNCLSQKVYSLFNFLGIMKQLSMYPWVPLQESVLKKNCMYNSPWGGHNSFEILCGFFLLYLTRYWNGASSITALFDPHWEGCGVLKNFFLLLPLFIWAQLDFSYERGD